MSSSLRESIEQAMESQETQDSDLEKAVVDDDIHEEVREEPHEASEADEPETDATSEEEDELSPPDHWAAGDKKVFNSLNKEGRAFLLRRHKEMESSFTKKNQSLSEQIKFAENIRSKIEPYEHYLKQNNIDPAHAFELLLATEVRLRTSSPEEKARLIQDLAAQYGAQYNPSQEEQYIDPQQQAILNKLAQQEDQLRRIEQDKIRSEESYLQNTIHDFMNAKDEKGQPKYPHFEEVRSDMSILLSSGRAKDLSEAYEQAIYLNPDLRKEFIMRQYNEQRRASDTRAKSDAAKRAGFNVKSGSTASISDQPEPLGLRETLAKAYDSQLRATRI